MKMMKTRANEETTYRAAFLRRRESLRQQALSEIVRWNGDVIGPRDGLSREELLILASLEGDPSGAEF